MLKSARLNSAFNTAFFVARLVVLTLVLAVCAKQSLAAEEKEHLSAVLSAFSISDPSREQNLFCRGSCHLAKSSHRFTSVDIENGGYRTLLEVLSAFPGVYVTKDHFGRPIIGLEGLLGNQRLQILIDNQRISDPFDGTAILNMPADVIDFVDVYFGPGGTWFGEGSLQGVIAVFTKQLPELSQFGQFSYDKSLGGGFMGIVKRNAIKTGAFGAFSVTNPESLAQDTSVRMRPELSQFALHSLSASGFAEVKISNTAQAYLLARSAIAKEFFGPNQNYGFGRIEQSKLTWTSDIHLLKKRAQKNALDLFAAFGMFQGASVLNHNYGSGTATFSRLEDQHTSLRFELGTKFHVKPYHGHDLYFGLGGILQGAHRADHHFVSEQEGWATHTTSPLTFAHPPRIFGRPSALFVATTGHAYGFIQDEWQIRAPLLFTVGSRLILPVETQRFAAELLPNVAAVLIPISKLRFTIAYQTSLRVPTVFEQSDRMQDALLFQNPEGFSPASLDTEKSSTIETALWYGEVLGTTQFKTSLAVHLSKIDDAISTSLRGSHNNKNEIHVAGFRTINEAIFSGGHSLSLGTFYSMAFRKEFDESGYSTCQAGFIKGFSVRRYCPFEDGVPRFRLKANVFFDLASTGGLHLATSFSGESQLEDIITEPLVSFESTYSSKPIWRYLTIVASVRNSFFGFHYRKQPDMITRTRVFTPSTLAFLGWRVNL